jgi:8-hydroxy-5-deazaflavin:NADPH oxidoreductase
MKVGILGSGAVATVLGSGFTRHGHDVMLGSRTPAKLGDWAKANPKARVGTFREVAAASELLVLAVKGLVAADALRAAGADNLKGKTLIDTTNPIADGPPEKGVLRYFTTFDESLMEQLQKEFAEARFVKAFNSVGSARMVNPSYAEGRPSMFICGDHAGAKQQVGEVLDQFGWSVEDMGGVEAARAIEPLCMLWCIPGFLRNEWQHAFKLLR